MINIHLLIWYVVVGYVCSAVILYVALRDGKESLTFLCILLHLIGTTLLICPGFILIELALANRLH